MIRTTHFHYPSARDGCSIHALEWAPEGPPRGIVHLVHGISEHIGRYDETARFLAEHGFLVCGEDHLGHGRTVTDGSYGFFAPENGWTLAARDVRALRKLEGARHPNLPYFLLGHSMGSFLTRTYLILWPGTVSGAVLMGTGQEPAPLVALGKPWSAAAWVPVGSVRWYTPCPLARTTGASAPAAPPPTGSPGTRRRWTPFSPTPSASPAPPSPCSGT